MIALPTINDTDPCHNCGACCRGVSTPPGMFRAYILKTWDGVYATDHPDYGYWQAMPSELREHLRIYYRFVEAGMIPARVDGVDPCFWHDPDTKRCRNYEWRPETCREFEPGSEDCLEHPNRKDQ